MQLQTATQVYQQALEALRREEESPRGIGFVVDQLREDLEKARAAMEVAWCEGLLGEAGC